MPQLHVLRVFIAPDGSAGNPLGVFVDGTDVPADQRQTVATDLGYSETVFVDDTASGELRIFTPGNELPFAGHPLVGTAWLLDTLDRLPDPLRPPAGDVPTWIEEGERWIRGRAGWIGEIIYTQLDTPDDVTAMTADNNGYYWAWEDEAQGHVRSRFFAGSFGIPEDPATGAAAVGLATQLARPIQIRQGEGSILHARPGPDGTAEVGGLVVLDDTRDYTPPAG
ncbi:MAG TPA: PhzF family phenazine biosynthesis protein [Dehalococcoidia bacterium]|nr:PhzF family phenazine biosynthesis protein [Dehalococcoidia bacterium]